MSTCCAALMSEVSAATARLKRCEALHAPQGVNHIESDFELRSMPRSEAHVAMRARTGVSCAGVVKKPVTQTSNPLLAFPLGILLPT